MISRGFLVTAGRQRMDVWCRLQDSNPPPHDYKSSALPDELSRHEAVILLHFTILRRALPPPFDPSSSGCGPSVALSALAASAADDVSTARGAALTGAAGASVSSASSASAPE